MHKHKKYILAILLCISYICNAQSYLSFGGAIVAPKTDTGNETGASIIAMFNHNTGYFILQPTLSFTMMAGIDNPRRRERQYSYSTTMLSTGLNIMNTGRLYGIIGIHYNGNIVASEFKLKPNQFDKLSSHNLFLSEYIGIGYHTLVNLEFGIFYTNTNYMDGYYPITSKHNDMYMQFKISYDMPVINKCKCRRNE